MSNKSPFVFKSPTIKLHNMWIRRLTLNRLHLIYSRPTAYWADAGNITPPQRATELILPEQLTPSRSPSIPPHKAAELSPQTAEMFPRSSGKLLFARRGNKVAPVCSALGQITCFALHKPTTGYFFFSQITAPCPHICVDCCALVPLRSWNLEMSDRRRKALNTTLQLVCQLLWVRLPLEPEYSQ